MKIKGFRVQISENMKICGCSHHKYISTITFNERGPGVFFTNNNAIYGRLLFYCLLNDRTFPMNNNLGFTGKDYRRLKLLAATHT